MIKNRFESKCKIDKIGITNDTLTSRDGMPLFVRYLSNVSIITKLFGDIVNNKELQCGTYSSRCFVSFTMGRVDT